MIRDKKTNESLCYAFIEFAEKKSAEDAYFKMENVLIDDRRIHVDFSQSVSKLHMEWLGKLTVIYSSVSIEVFLYGETFILVVISRGFYSCA